MKVDKFVLWAFDSSPKDVMSITIPTGGKILKPVILPEGIFIYCEVPELAVDDTDTYYFTLMGPDRSVPQNSVFIDLLSTVIEDAKGQQGIAVYPIYQLK